VQETVWLGDIPVATLRPNGSGGVDLYYVHTDHLNTPRLVTDTANNIRWRWDSDAFGTTPPNENPSSLGAFEYNLRFPGQQYDSVVGLHYNYYRDLDPATGRYVESDPIGIRAGPSLYAYARNSPSSLVDPTGLLALTVATQWSEVSTLAEGHLGFTYADIIHTKCTCACSNGEWKLVGCSSTLLIDVSLRPDYTSRRQEQFARRGEQQHVDDFKKGAAEVRRAGEEREWALRYEPFSSKSQCEKFISSDVEYAMKQALGNVLEETLDRDRHGEHTYPFKE
jgi:RHS repeat-associated protein